MAISILSKELMNKDFVVVDDFVARIARGYAISSSRDVKRGRCCRVQNSYQKVRQKGKNVRKEYVERLRKTTRSDLVFWCNGDRKGEECVGRFGESSLDSVGQVEG